MIQSSFWSRKKVFVTGHTGFKGSWLTLWLKNLGSEVAGFSLETSTQPNLYTEANVQKGIHSTIGDIRNGSRLEKSIKSFRPDVVIHMAAQAYVSHGYKDPFFTYSTNIGGTLNVLEICRALKNPPALVNVTSDKCYENKGWRRGYKESDPLGGTDPYSSSKAASDSMTLAYVKSFNLQAATARAGNVIGGGDWAPNRIIPDCVRAWMKKKPVSIRHPQANRPWQHVLNPLSGYLVLAEKLFNQPNKFSGPWNFGPSRRDNRSVLEVVKIFQKSWGQPSAINTHGAVTFKEHMNLHVDSGKSEKYLGWAPAWGLIQGVQKTAEWYRAFIEKENLEKVCLQQIQQFQKKCHERR